MSVYGDTTTPATAPTPSTSATLGWWAIGLGAAAVIGSLAYTTAVYTVIRNSDFDMLALVHIVFSAVVALIAGAALVVGLVSSYRAGQSRILGAIGGGAGIMVLVPVIANAAVTVIAQVIG